MFAFPPLMDVKMDQPQTEIVIDRDKVAALGLSLQQVGADLSAAVGGNFVNRFNIAGRSYKVIPQVQRASRLNPDQLEDIYVTGPDNQLSAARAPSPRCSNSTGPRSLNRFQQLNAVKISGVAIRPLDEALRFLEDEAAKLMPQGLCDRLHRRIAAVAAGRRRTVFQDHGLRHYLDLSWCWRRSSTASATH
jgi:multidrug efflux pump